MQKDDSTWLNIAYACTAILIGFVFWKSFDAAGLQFGWADRYASWYNTASSVLSCVLGAGIVYYLRADPERHDYFLTAISELRKVMWPSWDVTRKLTLVVCVVVAIFSTILTVFDLIWAKVLRLLLT